MFTVLGVRVRVSGKNMQACNQEDGSVGVVEVVRQQSGNGSLCGGILGPGSMLVSIVGG